MTFPKRERMKHTQRWARAYFNTYFVEGRKKKKERARVNTRDILDSSSWMILAILMSRLLCRVEKKKKREFRIHASYRHYLYQGKLSL